MDGDNFIMWLFTFFLLSVLGVDINGIHSGFWFNTQIIFLISMMVFVSIGLFQDFYKKKEVRE